MSAQINQELQASGIAKVIVVIRSASTKTETSSRHAALEKYFATSDLSQSSALAASTAPRGKKQSAVRYYPHLGVMLGTVTREGLAQLRAEKTLVANVMGAPPLSLIRPTRIDAAKLTNQVTWGLNALGIPQLWKEGYTGKDVLIGHLDTGIDGRHPALKNAIAEFAAFDLLGQEAKPAPKPYDSDDHGTHTAATIAGRTIRGRAIGVAPDAKLASAVVIEGGNVIARVLGGMDWAVGKGVRILNMSLGFPGWWQDFLPITKILRRQNILPVFAVGNEGAGTSRSPGNYWQALSVGAIDEQQAVADFSSSQRFKRKKDALVPDLVAPGVGIISARRGGGYQEMDGTSMATPHISGLAALLWQARPAATEDQIEQAIFASCQRYSGIDSARGNRGMPNGPRALAALLKM